MNISVPEIAHTICRRVQETGGEAHVTGGWVRDHFRGVEPNDLDIEVFGMSYERLKEVVEDLEPKAVGKTFGILALSTELCGGVKVDLNVPRKDNRVGVDEDGWGDTDPRMSVEEACLRRDFTVNGMAYDPLTGILTDPRNGMQDCLDGVLRATEPILFVQDVNRVLRTAQFLARWPGSRVDGVTMSLLRAMSYTGLEDIPKERQYEEWKKLVMKGVIPSRGLTFLSDVRALPPELKDLQGCEQNPKHHPEGDVWVHSLLAADAMAQVRHLVPETNGRVPVREAFCFAVLLHDVGKPSCTITEEMLDEGHPHVAWVKERSARSTREELLLSAIGHDTLGVGPCRGFMQRLTDAKKVTALASEIVRQHMRPYYLCSGNAGQGAYAKSDREMRAVGGTLGLLGHMCRCDACATSEHWMTRSLGTGTPNWEHETSERVFEWNEKFEKDATAIKPKVQGRDLIAAGRKPGRDFGKLLERALEIQDADASLTKEEIIAQVLSE